jgi:endonuclease-3 related protein
VAAEEARLWEVYRRLLDEYGPQQWWPAKTPFEVVIGAILTQNTAWTNVERAIAALDGAGGLTPEGLRGLERSVLEGLIRPAGFFRQKAERLQAFVDYLQRRHAGSLTKCLGGDIEVMRRELLDQPGIGPETADSILLYAGGHPSFVVDAYTRRLFHRLGQLRGDEDYRTVRTLFMTRLPVEAALFNEYHALIVVHCKRRCRKSRPLCSDCPLLSLCSSPQLPAGAVL